jgi:hypothetical protein
VSAFFVPAAESPEQAEEVYAQLAAWCSRPVPAASSRVRRIVWLHDGEEWVAEVGQTLRGTRSRRLRRQGQMREVSTPLSDPATVLAIFPGSPYFVVTNGPGVANVRSTWENPFMAGQPSRVELFDGEG